MDDNFEPQGLNLMADLLTLAHRDHSGLATAVSEYMGKEGAPGIPEVRKRAHEAGLDDMLQGWRDAVPRRPATASVVKTLIPDDKIARFAQETGISPEATIKGLMIVIPGIVYRNAQRERQNSA